MIGFLKFVLVSAPLIVSTRLILAKVPTQFLSERIVVASVLCWCQIVLAAHLLSLAGELNFGGFALLHWSVAVLAALVSPKSTQPASPSNRRRIRAFLQGATGDLRLLLLIVAAAYAVLLGVGVAVAPNNYDAMTYHLARIGHWIQNESLANYPTPNVRQLISPPNAEIGMLWTMLSTGGDRLVCFVQWAAALTGAAAIFGLARMMRRSANAAAFAALLWLSLPEILLQAASAKNDLLTASFGLAAAYLVILGIHRGIAAPIVLAATAGGLALGTKLTAILVAPALIGLGMVGTYRLPGSLRSKAAAAALAILMATAAPVFVLNLLEFQHPLGPSHYVTLVGNQGKVDAALVLANLARHFYSWFDLTGLPIAAANTLVPLKAAIGEEVFAILRIDPNPAIESTIYPKFRFDQVSTIPHIDLAWFGPLGSILLIGMLVAGVRALLGREPVRSTLLACCVCFAVGASYALGWNPWAGRHFVVFAAFAAPLAADLWSSRPTGVALRVIVVALAAWIVPYVVLNNVSKPVGGGGSSITLDRISQQSLTNPSIQELLRTIERKVPSRSTIGWIAGGDDWEYPLFGAGIQRRVIALLPPYGDSLKSAAPDFVVARRDLWNIPVGSQIRAGDWLLIDVRNSKTGDRALGDSD